MKEKKTKCLLFLLLLFICKEESEIGVGLNRIGRVGMGFVRLLSFREIYYEVKKKIKNYWNPQI